MYEKYLTNRSIFFNWQTLLLILIYFTIRILSFGLAHHIFLQAVLIFVILMFFGAIYYKNQDWACYILLGELFLGGAGHFFEFLGLSIRTILFITFITLWFIQTISNSKREMFDFPKKIYYLLIIFGIFLIFSAITGIYNNHGIKPVIQDILPYGFLALIFPFYHLFEKKQNQEYLARLLIVFLFGSAIFSLFTFVLFSSGAEYLQSPYYKWFRDVAMGKITDMGNGFFRIVTPEHLLSTPLILLLSSLLMRNEKRHKMWWVALIVALSILILDFSRIYLLALGVGLLILKYKHNWKNWLFVSFSVCFIIIALFGGINTIASRGQTFGLDLFLGRVKSLSQPKTEISSLTRMTLLAPIINMIKKHPIMGSGIGSKLIFIDPISNELIKTSHFDWGYLELWAELGALGAMAFLSIIFYAIISLIKKIKLILDFHDFYIGLLAGLISLLTMNTTAPILFHPLGIFYLVFVIAITSKPHSL